MQTKGCQFVSLLIFPMLWITGLTTAIAHAQTHPEGNPEAPTCWEGDANDPSRGGIITWDHSRQPHLWICDPDGDYRWHQIQHLHNSIWLIADAMDDTNCHTHRPSPLSPSPPPAAWHLLTGDGIGNWCARRLQLGWPTTQP
jgi:hypothetical protein